MTVRTKAELDVLFADNAIGAISAEDLRDLTDTVFSLGALEGGTSRRRASFSAEQTGPTKPEVRTIGPTSTYIFDVGDLAHLEAVVPVNLDEAETVTIKLDWAPTAAEVGKTVSWELDYAVATIGMSIETIDGTLTATDEAVPATQYELAETEFTLPASVIGAAEEIHFELRRVASTDDPAEIAAVVVILEYSTTVGT